MKKFKGVLIIILVLVLMATGCQDNKKNNNSGNFIGDEDIVDGEVEDKIDENQEGKDEEDLEIKIMDTFLDMIEPETAANELAAYIRANIQYVDSKDAESMIEYLLIYQTEIIDNFNNQIYEEAYMQALNSDMEGVLDREKIDNILDESIRSDYQELIDSILTIRRYEEHPAVETDWQSLKEFSSYVSKDFSQMIDLYSKIQNYEYKREELDVSAIAEDMIKTESILKNQQENFMEKKINQLYNLQIYALLIGPEGTYLDMWIHKDGEGYKNILGLVEKYPTSILAEIISHINQSKIDSIMDVIDIIDENLEFELKSDYYIDSIDFIKDKGEYKILQIRMPDNREKENSINNLIKSDMRKYIEETRSKEEFLLTTYVNYGDRQYISYEVFVDYYNSQSSKPYIIFYRTLDYLEEKYISLDDYLGLDFISMKSDLEEISGKTIKTLPDFQLIPSGVNLYLNELNGMDGYIHLNHKDLLPYNKK